MLTVFAPYPDTRVTMYLPNPVFGDGQSPTHKLTIKRMMDNTVVTHVTKQGTKRLRRFQFILTRLKALEYITFIEYMSGEKIRLLNDDIDIIGYIKTNPTDLNFDASNTVSVSLEIEATE